MIAMEKNSSIKHFDGLKAEIDRKYELQIAELRKAREAQINLLKSMAQDLIGPNFEFKEDGRPRTDIALGSSSYAGQSVSNSEQVLSSLTSKYQTLEEITLKTTLDESQVRSALYSTSNRSKIGSKKQDGIRKFRLKPKKPERIQGVSKSRQIEEFVLRFVNENGPSSAAEIRTATVGLAKSLFPKEETAKSTIRSSVLKLKRAGKIRYSEASTKYYI